MRRYLQYVVVFIICLLNIQVSIAQTWTFGKNVTNTSYTAFSAKMARGTDGSIFIGDTFIDDVIIGSKTYKPVNSDFFITKQNSSGDLEWSISDKGLPVGHTPSSFQSALASLAETTPVMFLHLVTGDTRSTPQTEFFLQSTMAMV